MLEKISEFDFCEISNQIHELKTEVNSLNIMCSNMRSEMSELRRIGYENNKLLALICYRNDDSETEQFVSFCYCSWFLSLFWFSLSIFSDSTKILHHHPEDCSWQGACGQQKERCSRNSFDRFVNMASERANMDRFGEIAPA